MSPFLIALPFLSAFIGWLTNYAAIKMLFRPKNPIGPGSWKVQGMVPRRQKELASRLGVIVENEILGKDLIRRHLGQFDLRPHLAELSRRLVREKLMEKLEKLPLLGGLLPGMNLGKIEDFITAEMERQVYPMLDDMITEMQGNLPIRSLVEEQINALDVDSLEAMIERIARKEFRAIEIMGAILGFAVGLIQLLLLYLTGQLG